MKVWRGVSAATAMLLVALLLSSSAVEAKLILRQ